MERKTRKQIIDETAGYYTSRNRATCDDACVYKASDGRMCAVGRCCIEPKESWLGLWPGIRKNNGLESLMSSDELLKPEYRGHPQAFWVDLQNVHDCSDYWNADGPNRLGKQEFERLHKKWDEHAAN